MLELEPGTFHMPNRCSVAELRPFPKDSLLSFSAFLLSLLFLLSQPLEGQNSNRCGLSHHYTCSLGKASGPKGRRGRQEVDAPWGEASEQPSRGLEAAEEGKEAQTLTTFSLLSHGPFQQERLSSPQRCGEGRSCTWQSLPPALHSLLPLPRHLPAIQMQFRWDLGCV